MFSQLSDKLQDTFRDLRGRGKISEDNITDALREVRMALLEADVDYKVARDFIKRVREKSLGEEVLRSVTPGQQIVKIFNDELTELLGGDAEELNLEKPTHIMMVGLHGSGKTTTSAKLAKYLKKNGRQPGLIPCDLIRPAAVNQLITLGQQTDVPTFEGSLGQSDVLQVAREAVDWAEQENRDVRIFDTAGRLEIDEVLVEELKQLKEAIQPQEILLVCDSATGQQAVSVANHFHEALGITGIILTKVDGDARGGAALSMREVTQRPIKFVGVGEKPDDFEPFYPDRFAGRILGMGDVVGLVEKAAEAIDEKEAMAMEERLRKASFTFEDFLQQMKMLKKMGPLGDIMGLMPGMPKISGEDMAKGEKQMKHVEAIILSMTPQERRKPEILNARRRKRIARGSGTTIAQVNNLIRQFAQMRKLMKNQGKMKKLMKQFGGGAGNGGPGSLQGPKMPFG
jgi:signal recognition particle subunit SRP54